MIAPATTDQLERRRFYHETWRDATGWVEVVAGLPSSDMLARGWPTQFDGSPDQIDLLMWTHESYDRAKAARMPYTRKFFHWPEQEQVLDHYIKQLARAWGNVYVSASVYADESRRNPLPGRVILVEDAPLTSLIPPSFQVQTSPGSTHAYYVLDQVLAPEQLTRLARGLTEAFGGDPSGVDRQQLVRVPTSSNTKAKYGAPFRVRLISADGPTYTPDALRQLAPEAEQPDADASTLEWPAAERHIANIDRLITSARFRLIKPGTQAGRILGGEMLAFPVARDGKETQDNSTSMNRCAVAHGLRSRGFPDDEIAAVLWVKCDFGARRRKGSTWFKDEIKRCIADARAHYTETKTSPTHYGAPAPAEPLPEIPRPTRGRPIGDRAKRVDRLCRYLQKHATHGEWRGLVETLADALKISERTIRDYLKELRGERPGQGEIASLQEAGNGRLVILLLIRFRYADKSPHRPPTPVHRLPIRVADGTPVEAVETPQRAENPPQCMGGTHHHTPPPVLQPVAAPPPTASPASGCVCVGCWPGEDAHAPAVEAWEGFTTGAHSQVEPATKGSLVAGASADPPRRPSLLAAVRLALDTNARASLRRVRAYLDDNWPDHPWSPASVERVYQAELARRRAAPWRELREGVAELSDATLLKVIRARQRTLTRHVGKPREGYHRVRLQIAEEERQRRGLACIAEKGAIGVPAGVAGGGVSPLPTPGVPQTLNMFAEHPASSAGAHRLIDRVHVLEESCERTQNLCALLAPPG